MNLPQGVGGYDSVSALAQHLRNVVAAIVAGWNQNHRPDGSHSALTWSGDTQRTVGAAGGASALPATPSGYLVITIDGVEYAVPYYAQS